MILANKLHQDKNANSKKERFPIIRAAAYIILENIRSQAYNVNEYPPTDPFCQNVDPLIASSVFHFFEIDFQKQNVGHMIN